MCQPNTHQQAMPGPWETPEWPPRPYSPTLRTLWLHYTHPMGDIPSHGFPKHPAKAPCPPLPGAVPAQPLPLYHPIIGSWLAALHCVIPAWSVRSCPGHTVTQNPVLFPYGGQPLGLCCELLPGGETGPRNDVSVPFPSLHGPGAFEKATLSDTQKLGSKGLHPQVRAGG